MRSLTALAVLSVLVAGCDSTPENPYAEDLRRAVVEDLGPRADLARPRDLARKDAADSAASEDAAIAADGDAADDGVPDGDAPDGDVSDLSALVDGGGDAADSDGGVVGPCLCRKPCVFGACILGCCPEELLGGQCMPDPQCLSPRDMAAPPDLASPDGGGGASDGGAGDGGSCVCGRMCLLGCNNGCCNEDVFLGMCTPDPRCPGPAGDAGVGDAGVMQGDGAVVGDGGACACGKPCLLGCNGGCCGEDQLLGMCMPDPKCSGG